MKKSTKLLVLVLSLVLVFGMMAIVVNADDPSIGPNLASVIASAENGKVKLESDAYINQTLSLDSALSIDLNGYTIRTWADVAFTSSNSAASLTLTNGRIETSGVLYQSASATYTPTLTVDGVTVKQAGASKVTLIKMGNGSVTVKNSSFFSDAPYSGSTAGAGMFTSTASGSQDGGAWVFENISVVCETAAALAKDFAVAEAINNSDALLIMSGKKNTVVIKDSYIRFVGHLANASNVKGRSTLTAPSGAPASYDLSVPSYSESGPDGKYMYYTNVFEAYNTVIDTDHEYPYRNHFIHGFGTQGSFYFNACTITADYASSNSAYNSGALANDPMAVILDNGTVYRFSQIDNSGDKGCAVQNADLHLLGGSALISARDNTEGTVTRAGNIYAEVGARFATPNYSDRIIWLDKDGTVLSTVGYAKWTNNSSASQTYHVVTSASGVEFVLDPTGNPNAPWVAVKKGTAASYKNAQQNNLWTCAAATYLEQLDNYNFLHGTAANYNKGHLDIGIAKFVQDDLNPNGALVAGGDAAGFTSIVSANGSASPNSGKSTIDAFMNGYWWNQTGNIGILYNESNAYGRWYVPANPYDEDATTIPRGYYLDGNGAKKQYNKAEWGLTPKNAFPKLSTAGYSVLVYEADFATATVMPNLTVKLHSRDSSDRSFGSFNISNGTIVSNGYTNAVGATAEDLKLNPAGEWNNMTVVVYVDQTHARSGVQYWYLNGNLVAKMDGLHADAATKANVTAYGLRFVHTDDAYTVGQSFLFDNMGARFYNTTLFGDTAAAPTPDKYVSPLTNEKTFSRPEASIGSTIYETIEDAIAAADGRDINLLADVGTVKVTVDKVTRIYTNGYDFTPEVGSVSYFKDYGAKNYAPDGSNDEDSSGNQIYTFDASKTLTYKFFTGNPNNAAHLTDPEKYETTTLYVGQTVQPASLDTTTAYVMKEGQAIYKVTASGWATADGKSFTAGSAITESDYAKAATAGATVCTLLPRLNNATRITSNDTNSIVIADADGRFVKTVNGNNVWGGGINGWKLEYGHTIILNKSIKIQGSLSFSAADFSLERDKRVNGMDLNGYTLTYDPLEGGTDSQMFMQLYVGDTFNLYSSVAGGKIVMHGIAHENSGSSHGHYLDSQYIINVINPAGTGYAGQSLTSLGTDYSSLNTFLQTDKTGELDTFINIGDARDYNGNLHSGANLSLYCDGILQINPTSIDSEINIKDVAIYKNSFAHSLIMLNGYNGEVNISGVDIRDSRVNNNDVPLIFDSTDTYFVNTFVRPLASVSITDSTCYSVTSGAELIRGEKGLASVIFENFLSNGNISGDDIGISAITLGDGVAAGFTLDASDDGFVALADGIKLLPYNGSYNANNAQKLTFTVTEACAGNNLKASFTTSNVLIGSVGVPYITADNYATVTVIGLDGTPYSVEYAIGAQSDEADFGSVLGNHTMNVIKLTSKGTYNGGTVSFPFTVTGDTTLTLDATVSNNLSGFYSNISLSSYFKLNVYVPAAYLPYISGATLDGEATDITAASTTTINGNPYYVLYVWRNASEVSSDMKLVLNLSEGGYERTASFTLSILDYSDRILNGEYTAEEKALMKYIIAYSKSANDYIDREDALINDAYVDFGASSLPGFDKLYTPLTAENQSKLATAFSSATVTLKNSAPAFIFTVNNTYSGNVTIGSRTYSVTPGQQIVIDNIMAYNFLSDLKIKMGDTTATFSFGNYAAYSYGKNEKLDSIIDAVYDYCMAASTFTTLPKHTVTFDAAGGNAPSSTSVVSGMPIPSVNATRKGYTFLGWYNGDTPWDSSTVITENITLTAKWRANTYTVSFDNAGVGASFDPITVTYGSAAALPELTNGNYTLVGWYFGDVKANGDKWNIAENVKLTAKWDLISERNITVTIAGNPISDYAFKTDLNAMKDLYTPSITGFDDLLYIKTGNRFSESADAKYDFIVRYVENAGETGFRAYVDSEKNFIVECSYYNVFDQKYEDMANDIFFKTSTVNVGSSFEKTYDAHIVYYADFGAKGDGVTDDYAAIYNTHAFANQCGQKVMGDGPDARYYINYFNKTIPVMTDVDFNGATFYLDDTGDNVYSSRGTHLFTLTSTAKSKYYNASQIQELFPGVEIDKGATALPWLADHIDTVSFVTIWNEHKDYIRHGANTSSGYRRQDMLIINPDGTLHEDTPVIWDYKAGEQYMHNWYGTKFATNSNGEPTWWGAKIVKHDAISSIKIIEADDEPITVENGFFERKVCRTVAATGFENVYHAYGRGISIRRCNSTIKNLTHHNLDEPEFHAISNSAGSAGTDTWKAYYGVNTSKGDNGYYTDSKGSRYFIDQSYPYGGFLAFSETYNSRAVDCNLTGRTVYYEAKTTSSTPIAMGSYDLTISGSTHVYIENVQQLNDINDTQYWGIMNSNRAKNLFFIDSSLSRFDAHEGFWNGTFINTTFGRYINVIGGGYLKIDGCTRNVGRQFISLRGDYGATFNGTIEIKDCTMRGLKEYRRAMNAKPYWEDGELNIINSGYSSKYNENYTPGNAGSFPYLKWNFGYTCYMPQHVIIDNFQLAGDPNIVGQNNQTQTAAKLYIFNNQGDAAFVKPSSFVNERDYTYSYVLNGTTYSGTQQVTLADGTKRNMTAADIYYNQYQLTKRIDFKNMSSTIPICSNSSYYMYKNIPVYINASYVPTYDFVTGELK